MTELAKVLTPDVIKEGFLLTCTCIFDQKLKEIGSSTEVCLCCSYPTPHCTDIDIILNSMTVMIDISLQEDTEDQNSA